MRLKATWLAEDMIFEAGQRWISETEGPALVQLSSGEKGRRAVGSRLAASSRAVSFTGAFASVMMMYVPVYVTYVYTHARGKQETQINRSNNNSKQTMCIYIYIYYMCMCIIYIYIYIYIYTYTVLYTCSEATSHRTMGAAGHCLTASWLGGLLLMWGLLICSCDGIMW